MKKIIALLLCCFLCLSLFAACDKQPSEDPTEHTHDENGNHVDEGQGTEIVSVDEHSDHNHVNYKGLNSASVTLEDVAAAEGKEPDFSFESSGITYYAYNNVTLDSLQFSQVQYSFGDSYVRISCTYTGEEALDEVYSTWEQTMTDLYGDSSQISAEGSVSQWTDHTGNYVTLTQLNDTTLQLCYYLVA